MKVIFLDIDGVLNTNSDREISNDKLKLLSELVSKTGADVVLSSSWRYGWNQPEKNQPGTRIYNLKQLLKDNDIVIKDTIGLDLTKSTPSWIVPSKMIGTTSIPKAFAISSTEA